MAAQAGVQRREAAREEAARRIGAAGRAGHTRVSAGRILGDGGAGRGIPRLEMPAPAGEGGEQCESSMTRSA